jgi:hypothetical protein
MVSHRAEFETDLSKARERRKASVVAVAPSLGLMSLRKPQAIASWHGEKLLKRHQSPLSTTQTLSLRRIHNI